MKRRGIIGGWLFLLALTTPERLVAAPDAPSFAEAVQPLLVAKCSRCHGRETQKAELSLHAAGGIQKGGESGPVIVAGKPDESPLFEKIHAGEMPPDQENPLTEAEIELIRRWIEAGASFGQDAPQQVAVTYHDILPIVLLRCASCHGRQRQEGGLDLRSRGGMLKGGKSGPAIVPGKPDESLMVKRVRAAEMPPHARLVEAMVKPMEPAELARLEQWIAQGAPDAAAEPDLAGTAQDPLVSAADREFWAFKRPQASVPPTVSQTALVRNPIDAFVLSKLEAAGLSLSPETDRRTLARRAYFDLTGLPPEPVEVEVFATDPAPDAYEHLIDRLLASPRYGERWGRHWLDVAGYADCEGRREQHLPRDFAWRYRDYVIRSFNADKPYDRFLVEQLAGDDLVDIERPTARTQEFEDCVVATGFLRMAPDPTWANLTGFVPDRLEVIADAVDVLGSGVMGLTFKCARCHSHKFDPIPQRDYYRLTAMLKGAYDEHDWLKPQLIGYGGAVSAGAGERFLTCVADDERRRYEAERDKTQQELATLRATAETPERNQRIKELESRQPAEPKIMALWDRGEPSPTYIYRRGDYQNAGALVSAGVPAVLADPARPLTIAPPRAGAASTGRRLALARWLVDPQHPLTSRVMVNRIWKHHFGQGLVKSLGNFGRTGDPPSHPELLDWLACEFMRQGWSMKAMHRVMMTSSVYRQSSAVTPAHEKLDPDNRLLSRMPLRRLEAEELRDTLLLAAGRLDEKRFGPADPVQVLPDGIVQSGQRRSIYVQQLRKHPPTLLECFDLPAMNPNCLSRSDSLVALQALHLLNDTTVRELAGYLAKRVQVAAGSRPADQVRQLYLIALSRPPTAEENSLFLETHARLTEAWQSQLAAAGAPGDDAATRALATLCHTMVNSAMFLYVD
ncbi:MAG TPA: PSD1 and planctomycete cytochrome C domain-containing protein [Pirellulales bacterium]|nr:PSD1 and planctomycete cytochrome C domain-containing protein [Pirellulales bacterium]